MPGFEDYRIYHKSVMLSERKAAQIHSRCHGGEEQNVAAAGLWRERSPMKTSASFGAITSCPGPGAALANKTQPFRWTDPLVFPSCIRL